MEELLTQPVKAGDVALARISLLELKEAEARPDNPSKQQKVFRRAWKFYVENRREEKVSVTFHFTMRQSARGHTEEVSTLFEMTDIDAYTAVGSVFKPMGEDQKLSLDSMQIQGEGGEIEVVPIELNLGYTGSFTQVSKVGMTLGGMFGKIKKSFRAGLDE